ncbi:MAG: site-specific integrase, partial [Nitrospinota bacterium]|nr:site-specific integrase [Nitrospinota bacterium]
LEDNRRARFLSQEEIGRLMEAAARSDVQYLRPIIVMALNTTMRLGEILNLRWEDLDLGAGMIHILKSKSGKGREIPMSDQLRDEFSRIPRLLGSEYVFPGKTGEPLKVIKRSWHKALRGAQIKDVTFHTLRHTAASYLVMCGIDIRTVQDILGHADIRMTMRYAHLSPAHKSAAVQKLGNLLEASQDVDAEKNFPATGTY